MRVAAGTEAAEASAAALGMASWADRLDFETVNLSEHHAPEYGYLPAPLVFGGAVAGRTVRYGSRRSSSRPCTTRSRLRKQRQYSTWQAACAST